MRSCKTLTTLAALIGLLAGSSARAQEPDVRDIEPFVMLVVDTSGSMEDLPGNCTDCTPDCNATNVDGEPPRDPSTGLELKKNRWAVTLEALTGKFVDYQCTPLARTAENGMTYDSGYSVPYHQPWKCSSGDDDCAYPGPDTQLPNGILDTYAETLQFGLMTFDGERTWNAATDLVNEADFSANESLNRSTPGMWSYGENREFKFPGCKETYFINTGVRGADAAEGALVSLGSKNCADGDCDQYELNAAIQETLLRARPYWGTPIAGALHDLHAHLKNDVKDDYAACRKRYAILITDGEPDKEFRDLGCACETDEDPTDCGIDPETGLEYVPGDFKCPYPLAKDTAKLLVSGDASNPKPLEKLFVLGMSIKSEESKQVLDEIANYGNTTRALQADDPNTLRSTLDGVFSPLLNPISRSVPGFATGLSGVQYQISTGFQVSAASLSTTTAPPWSGLIERRKFVCNSKTGIVETPDLEDADRFHKVLNNQERKERVYWTALPSSGTVTIDKMKGPLVRGSNECPTGCLMSDIDSDTSLPASLFGASATEAIRQQTVAWMYGDATVRADRKLGDIYHSSPTLIGPPLDEPADDAYTRFKERAAVKERPLVMYIATNDGVLHAISVEDFPQTGYPLTVHNGDTRFPMKAGEEFWGFVPPMLVHKLKDQMTSHQFNLDATPVVKDVYFKREGTAAETEYHTVLIMGMRGGGTGYFALDVTDPVKGPQFLWQFTDDDMGLTYGQPEIVQATFLFAAKDTDTPTLQTRAVAILPGGKGVKGTGPGCSFGKTPAKRQSGDKLYSSWTKDSRDSPGEWDHRPAVQCWQQTGRSLYFVDVETGRLIKKIFDTDDNVGTGIWFPSPIVGTPTAYSDAIGTIADRGFVIDADGVIWRIDMTSQDPVGDDASKGWTVLPFHDVFYDKTQKDVTAAGGETTYERPILSLDDQRRVVLLLGTGDTDNFEKKDADNRIVSLTEATTTDEPKNPEDYRALINWELRNEGKDSDGKGLYPGELVTGSMALFEGQLFAATFMSNAGSSDMCEYGRGRLWSVHYNKPDVDHDYKQVTDAALGLEKEPVTNGPLVIPVDDATDSDAELFNIPRDRAKANLLIQGLGTTQRTSCAPPDPDPLTSYFAPQLTNVQQTEQPAIWVVAQASSGSKRSSSGLGGVQAKVARRITFSRVTSWATSVD